MEIAEQTHCPPGPNEPFDLDIMENSFDVVARCVREYGDFVKVSAQTRKADSYIINHPDAIKHVLVNNHRNYVKGVGFERIKMLLGKGLITSDGDFWRSQRRMVQPAFHKTVLSGFADIIVRHNQLLLAEWERKSQAKEKINVTFDMSNVTLNIILDTLFGEDLQMMIEAHGSNPFSILTDDSSRNVQLAVKFRNLIQLIKDVMHRRRQEKTERADFLGMFMSAATEDGEGMSDKAIIDEVMTLIVAGHETTAGTLNWVWYVLSQHPELEAQFHAEMDRFEVDDIKDFTQSKQLDYTRKLIQETLRVYPSVWLFSRRAIGEDKIGEYTIPAGADIFISPYFVHRHSEFWPNAEVLDPERFSPQQMAERNRFAFVPFSAGPRRCIGDQFSIYEMLVHLCVMGKKLKLQFPKDERVELSPGMNLRSKEDLMMQAVPR